MRNITLVLVIVFSIALVFTSCNSPSPRIPDMTFVEGGMGVFGSDATDADADERPMRQTEISSFYISTFEITQSQWAYIMKENPSMFVGEDRPVECVSWYEVQEYISKLNALTGKKYRLPTELEWEYAARGGKQQRTYSFSGSDNCSRVAWWRENSEYGTSKVGEKKSNKLGIYDMTGNVHEWCANEYDSLLYSREKMELSINSTPISEVVVKGGDWQSAKRYLRIANRNHILPDTRNAGVGFRLVLEAE